ncbi:MAG: steroid 5-alpha reductase family enzyme [Planctomycetota bacterium]|jgi:steroid 5-alpha reductase family enzyme
MPNVLLLPFIATGLLVPLMALAWQRQKGTQNAGIVDLIWAASIGILGVTYGLLSEGWLPRRILVVALVGMWSLRLTRLLYKRVRDEPEDGRYSQLREDWKGRFDANAFWFFQAQAVLAVLLSLTFLPLLMSTESVWRAQDGLAVVLILISVFGEFVADRQLHTWRSNPGNRGVTCRDGLWAWSRHPNYFFEWLHWLSYPLMGIGLAFGALMWLAPALMLFLVLRVTGIPPTEQQSVKSRGDDYRAYQRETNAFFPGRPKRRTN